MRIQVSAQLQYLRAKLARQVTMLHIQPWLPEVKITQMYGLNTSEVGAEKRFSRQLTTSLSALALAACSTAPAEAQDVQNTEVAATDEESEEDPFAAWGPAKEGTDGLEPAIDRNTENIGVLEARLARLEAERAAAVARNEAASRDNEVATRDNQAAGEINEALDRVLGGQVK